ncbi:MAG: NADH:ubiquinone reductase (Na(+)-transporting) subunit C [Lentisphaerota bacterium]
MQKGDTYTIVFAAVVCLICSLLLSGTSVLLKKRQDAAVELDRKTNVLKAFGVAVQDAAGNKISEGEVGRLFSEHISAIQIDAASGKPSDSADARNPDLLPLYLWKDNGEVTKYAFPISGKGLWSTIYGYLALDKDLSTIAGITFYRHGETPGLGGEVEKDWFQDQFKGKKVFEKGASQRVLVVKGKVLDKFPEGSDHAVDGISGATLTGNGVTRFLNDDLAKYEIYFKGIRKGQDNHGG